MEDTTNTPIILVHGYHGSASVMNSLENFFRHHNHNNVYKFDYSKTTEEKIENNANRLWWWINENISPVGKVILIGHSMGGLVIRKMAADHPSLDVVKLVTLASPNFGAELASWCPGPIGGLCTDAVSDMAPSSAFLNHLNNNTINTYSEDKVLTYIIENDELVKVRQGIIEQALYCVVNSDLKRGTSEKHSRILEQQEVFEMLLKFIHGKVKTIDAGPGLRDANCSYWTWDNNTIRWDLPSGAPDSLKIDVCDTEKNRFRNEPAKNKTKMRLSANTIRFRFFDPASGMLTRWSSVKFHNSGGKCQSIIKNYDTILETWPE